MLILRLGARTIRSRVVRTPAEHTLGLQRHASLADDEGLLFVFDKVGTRTFHMGSVRFDIDIIGLDKKSTIIKIVDLAKPGTYETWTFPKVSAVLEVKGGTCRRERLKIGDVVVESDDSSTRTAVDSHNPSYVEQDHTRPDDLNQYRDHLTPDKRLDTSEFQDEPKEEYYHELWPDALADQALEPDIQSPVTRHGGRVGQIVDESKFVEKVSNILLGKVEEMQWTPDVLNGGATERSVVTRADLARWMQGETSDPESLNYILNAAGSDRGLSLIGDAFILANLADIARVGFANRQPTLVLYRET